MGKIAWPSGATYSSLAEQSTAVGGGAWAEHQMTEPLLRDFLALLEAIQEELNSRWNGPGNFGHHANNA
ncbi:hypothetical protein ABZT34_30635 [Streptomyces sp. NPDC005329]|uniref:hypothetical protein n=1 Tax=Streptomyces sp. NPDC005329 TaxID=3157034 RepID=UPI0033A863E3